jgi:hypothetical protein
LVEKVNAAVDTKNFLALAIVARSQALCNAYSVAARYFPSLFQIAFAVMLQRKLLAMLWLLIIFMV